MKKYFLSLSKFQQIGVVVLIAHAAMILSLGIHHFAIRAPIIQKPIAIRTIIPPQVQPIAAAAPVSQKTKPASKTSNAAAKPIAKSSKEIKKENSLPNLQQEELCLLQDLSQKLDTLSRPSSKKNSSPIVIALPDWFNTEHTESSALPSIPSGYADACSFVLENHLRLPELGEVVAHLIIRTDGTVDAIEIVKTQNQKNSDFLKKRLPELVFPCFNDFGITKSHVDFTITFRNAEDS